MNDEGYLTHEFMRSTYMTLIIIIYLTCQQPVFVIPHTACPSCPSRHDPAATDERGGVGQIEQQLCHHVQHEINQWRQGTMEGVREGGRGRRREGVWEQPWPSKGMREGMSSGKGCWTLSCQLASLCGHTVTNYQSLQGPALIP